MFGEYSPHSVLIDLDAEDEGNLLSDAPAAEATVAPLPSIAAISSGPGPFGPGFRRLGVKSNPYLRFTNAR
jgi:hypothetical protein